MTITNHGGSASINAPHYWWYVARTDLLRSVLEPYVGTPARVLDVGSADGPSVDWLRSHTGHHVTLDIDPRGLGADGVCGSALALPFGDETFDVIGAFDVLEHCEPEARALAEMARVLTPGGRLLISVPAYMWAWSDFDVSNGHHRRYTRSRAVHAIESAGLVVERDTYAFAGVLPFFAAERLARRLRRRARATATVPADVVELPNIPGWLSSSLIALSRLDKRVLHRNDLPFGSSVVVAARKPAVPAHAPAV